MSKQNQSKPAPEQLTLQGVTSQIVALETGLGLSGAGLSRITRKKTLTGSDHVPSDLIELVATHADSNAGMVAGMSFDAAAARAALTKVSEARAAVARIRQFAQRVEDDAIQQRATAADEAFAIFSAMRRKVRTPAGESLLDTYDRMQSAVRAHRKARTSKATGTAPKKGKGSKAKATAPTPTPVAPAQAGAIAEVVAPAQAEAPAKASATATASAPAETPAPAPTPTVTGPSPVQHMTSAT